MKNFLVGNALTILVILSFQYDQDGSFVSGTPLQRLKTEHEPNENIDFESVSAGSQRVLRERRSNEVNLNTPTPDKDSNKGSNTIIYVGGPVGIVLFVIFCLIGCCCQ